MTLVAELEGLASESGATINDAWGRSTVLLPGGDHDFARLTEMGLRHDIRFVASVDGDLGQFALSDDVPSAAVADAAARLASNVTMETQIRDAGSGWELAQHLRPSIVRIEARFERSNWCRTVHAFETALADDWLAIVDLMSDDTVIVGDVRIDLEVLEGAPSVRRPVGDQPADGGQAQLVWDGLSLLAEAAAWRNVASSEERRDGDLYLTLHDDQAIPTVLQLARTTGGIRLWQWATSTDDANRVVALRHVFRFITATSAELPVAPSVQALAERHRIALSRDNAAEVQRAIADGRHRTSSLLDSSQDKLAEFVEDTSKSAQSVVVATIGIVALVARSADALPEWLVVLMGVQQRLSGSFRRGL